MELQKRPKNITIDREKQTMQIDWGNDTRGDYPLRWLRANCPCATCREVRREASVAVDVLQLNSGPNIEPSTEVARAELVGNYAIRLEWTDGHGAGIFGFGSLRDAIALEKLTLDGSPIFNYIG
ncbi:MAG: DUF971 domain-containing protein [Chloroflexota bacterium]